MLAGDRQIAGGDELASGGGRDSIDRGDDRLGQCNDRLHERRTSRHQSHIVVAPAIGIVAMRLHLLEVVAAAERRSLAGEHDGARLFIGGDVAEGGDQDLDHLEAERVAVPWRRQRQGDAAAVVLTTEKGLR